MAGSAAAAPSTYERRLHEVHLRVLHNWRDLLTKPGMRTDTLGAAFAGVLDDDEGAGWRDAVAAGEASVAQLALPRLFPRLAPLVAKGYLEGLVRGVADAVVANTQAELGVIAEERGLPAKFSELERREAARRGGAGGAGAGASAAAALAVAARMPEDEVRSIAMEAKRGYEQQLRAQLESLRRENAELEADVAAADDRARKIKQSVDAKVKALSELGAVADGLRGLGDV
jgi:hypothetical protein